MAPVPAIDEMNKIATHTQPVVASRGQQKTSRLEGLRTPGLLGKWPLIGLVMVLLGSGLFGFFAVELQAHGPLIQTDMQVANNLHQAALQSPRFTIEMMDFGFYVGEQLIVVIGALLTLYFLIRHFWLELSMVLIAWAGEGGIWLILSNYFHRARPSFAAALWRTPAVPPLTVPGFPSGHSFSAVVCYGFLAYLLVPKMRSGFWKFVVIALAVFIMCYVGFSRVFVGDHFLMDVLAGYALGIAWSGLVYTSAELFARRKLRHKADYGPGPTPRPAEGK